MRIKRFTASGKAAAKSRAMAPPSDAPTKVKGRPLSS